MLYNILSANYYVSFAVGIALNSLLLWLIAKRTGDEMRAYRPILVQICCIDIATLVLAVVVQPVYLMIDMQNQIVASGFLVRSLADPWNFGLVAAWLFAYYACIVSVVAQFAYRYLVLCHSEWDITIKHYYAMVAGGVGVLFGYMGVLYWAMFPNDDRVEPIQTAVNDFFGLTNGDGSMRISMAGRPGTHGCFFDCLYVMIIELGSFTTIVYCAVKILLHFSGHTKQLISSVQGCTTSGCMLIKRHGEEMNHQIVSALIMQAAMPFLASAVNVFCVAVCWSANFIDDYVDVPTVVALLTVYFPWIPALNPLVTMLVVKSYRQSVFGYFRKGTAVGPTAKTTTKSSPHQHDSAVHAVQKKRSYSGPVSSKKILAQ